MSLGRIFTDVIEELSRSGRAQTKATKTLLICSLPRSGSNLLAETLVSTLLCGLPLEYFNSEYESEFRDQWSLPSRASVQDYQGEVLSRTTTPNGVFGLKIHWHQLSNLLMRVFPDRTLQESLRELPYLFPNIHYIYLSRRDKVRQAVSYARALQTNIWWRINGIRDPKELCIEPRFNPEKIAALVGELKTYEASWESFFQQTGATPLRLTYEDLVPHKAVESVMAFLGDSTSLGEIPSPRLQRQADQISEEWVLMFQRSMNMKNRHEGLVNDPSSAYILYAP